MRALILAAGVGRRLAAASHDGPKCLLEFGGETLLARHLRTLDTLGVADIRLCTGFAADRIEAALAESIYSEHVTTTFNPDYRAGSIVSLWCLRKALRDSENVLLMDADVLYAPAMLERLASSERRNCLLLDRDFESGEEPVKICLAGATIVEFGKRLPPALEYTNCGESIGFFHFTPAMAAALADRAEQYIDAGNRAAPYEDALRELILERPSEFGVEDVTGIPWIEIDFPADIERARDEVLPRIHGC
ncbi:phosphocholine cytidylyltransferase family protein [Nitrococcus mobilis]|uniref:MobA-like NTP transferase domain-containing protein n=1 Tax=Nitrococcus mobilis Nb-231 TaxID=314278 RepID=A4BTB6_9GAMM|nr:phosphocholine cytidylyltransferase family protein [Nitrococcus mobilis]EAR21018.1 hypothetical protein NB231_07607 [Nitrococcus mobilis Nb-231]